MNPPRQWILAAIRAPFRGWTYLVVFLALYCLGTPFGSEVVFFGEKIEICTEKFEFFTEKIAIHAPKISFQAQKITSRAQKITSHARKITSHAPKITSHAQKITFHALKTAFSRADSRYHAVRRTRLQMKSIIIGTAGHIDHGKTALVRAL